MHQNKQRVQSTKTKNDEQQEVRVNVGDIKHIMYTDQTGQFLVKSSQGNRYIVILCETDGNFILIKAIKNRTSGKMCKAYKELMERIKQSSITFKKHILDNKASEEFIQTIRTKKAPHMH